MLRTTPARIAVITSIFIVLAVLAANGFWSSGIGFARSAAVETQEAALLEPVAMTTPLNAITSFDAALIARIVVGLPPPFNANQLTVADVSGVSGITTLDAAWVSNYVVNNGSTGSTGTTVPPGLVMGDVSSAGPHYDGQPGAAAVSLPTTNAGNGGLTIPISVGNTSGFGIVSYEFQVTFDPTVLQPTSQPWSTTGTLSNLFIIASNANNPGHLIVSGFSSNLLAGSGTLLNLKFNIVGSPGQSTALTFEDYTDPGSRLHQAFFFNDGTPSATTTNGSVTLVEGFTPTPTATATPTASPTCIPVSVPQYLQAPSGGGLEVPVSIVDVTGSGVYSLDTQITFDPSVLTPAVGYPGSQNGVTLGSIAISNGSSLLVNSPSAGTLSISLFSTVPMSGAGNLVYLHFNVVGAVGTSSPLNLAFPVGIPCFLAVNGSVTVVPPVAVSLPSVNAPVGSLVTVPITVGDLTGLEVVSYDLDVRFNPAVLTPASPAVEQIGTLSASMNISPNSMNAGHLIVGAYMAPPPYLAGSGTLINLRFNVVGAAGQSSVLNFEDFVNPVDPAHVHPGFIFNEGNPSAVLTNGSIAIVAATATATPTPTFTATPQNTPTATPTIDPSARISGKIRYGNSIGAPALRYVPNVMMSGAGSIPVSAWSDTDGNYLLSGFGSGSYTITPSKTGSLNGSITSFDAARVSQRVAGIGNPFNAIQDFTADVSGSSGITSFDAAMIAKFVAGPPYAAPGIGTTASWKFLPTSVTHLSIQGNITDDFVTLLMGEVSGNWANSGARSEKAVGSRQKAKAGLLENYITVAVSDVAPSADKKIIVPVSAEGVANMGVISYEFELRYDAAAIQPQPDPVDLAKTVSRGLSVVVNAAETGLLRVVVYGAVPIAEDGILLNLRFKAVGEAGLGSPLTFERVMFNEGEPRVRIIEGPSS